MSGQKSVAAIAMPNPISPASTPRRAVWGEVIHFSENAKPSAATRYARLIQSIRLTAAPRRPRRAPAAAARGGRNIFSMRSVMRKPPTTLIVEATTATKPRTLA